MKRIVICLLSALLLLNLLACGKKDPEPSKPESPFDLGNYVSTGDRIVDPQNLEEDFLPIRAVGELEWTNASGEDVYDETLNSYPFFSDRQDAVTYAVNGMWKKYGYITQMNDQAVMAFGTEPAFYEWVARLNSWCDNEWRKKGLKDYIIDRPIKADGFIWCWYDSPHWPYPTTDHTSDDPNADHDHNYHYDQLPSYINAVYNVMVWEGNTDLLDQVDEHLVEIGRTQEQSHIAEDASVGLSVRDKIDMAMNYMMENMHGKDGLLLLGDQNDGGNKGRIGDFGSNYWDNFLFGYKDPYENMLFYSSLISMANIERMCGNEEEAQYYLTHAEKVKKIYNDTFWDKNNKRYVSNIDVDGVVRDFGMTFLNLEAVSYGLTDAQQTQYIYSWLMGNRIIESDAEAGGSTGDDIYKLVVGPRTNTVPIESQPKNPDGKNDPATDYWFFTWQGGCNVTSTHSYRNHFQNGGVIFYPTYYDIMNRVQMISPENAYNRLNELATEFAFDELYRRPVTPSGNGDLIGIINEFPESGLVPTTWLYGFMGTEATWRGLEIAPNIPEAYEYCGVDDLVYAGRKYKLTTYRSGKVVLDGKNAVDLKLVVRDYASKGAVTVKVYQQGRLINSTTVSASNGEFLIDLQGALRTAGQVVIE